MKKHILFAIAILYCGISFSQSFNYQAVVRDASNNPIINQNIGVQIKLIRSNATIYQETHQVTSNANGVISLAVGTGTSSIGNFATIDWSTQDFTMDIAVDVSGQTNYTSIGTTVLRQVPYALYAAAAPSTSFFSRNNSVISNIPLGGAGPTNDDFVFGSYQLNSLGANNIFNTRMFFDKSKGAFRAGFTFSDAWNEENVGQYSVGLGEGGFASGQNSFSMGRNANATGNEAVAFGTNSGGFGNFSRGMGVNARAFGENATAIGRYVSAITLAEIHLGQYSTFAPGSADTWVPTDRLFVIGNGQEVNGSFQYSDALVMLKNGNTTLNGQLTLDGDNAGAGRAFTLPAQDGSASQVMATDGAGNVTWVTPAAAALPNGGTNGYVLSTDGTGNFSWVNNDILPSGGTSGYVLSTDGSGVYSWVTTDDADADATNEIELPTGGTDGQILKTNGAGVYNWIDQPVAGSFSTTANVTSNASGNIATDHLVFGSTQMDNLQGADDDSRLFFNKAGGAFRAGIVFDGEGDFDLANIGYASVGFGFNNRASGWYASVVGGEQNTAAGFYSIVGGKQNVALGTNAIALGENNNASAISATAIGRQLRSESFGQVTLGLYNTELAGNVTSYVAADRLFVIGNGFLNGGGVTRSDALVMLKNGNTRLNGQLSIDGDNQGAGRAYTLPAQDGTANQVMTTDGNGNVSWTSASSGGTTLPAGGNDGDVLKTDGAGNYAWGNNTEAFEAFSTPIFNTNWENYSVSNGNTYEDPRYRIEGNRVFIEGMCRKTSGVVSGDVIFTLPVGYRPAKQQIVIISTENGPQRLDIAANGDVMIAATFNMSQNWVSLSGVSFSID